MPSSRQLITTTLTLQRVVILGFSPAQLWSSFYFMVLDLEVIVLEKIKFLI